ncbi:type II toxin-antitoxin system RelE/ParE family toxin [Terrimonas alba]|uniref:type II toxin-antitoxin system RelE/ParE family toxin n=1 Tax=Terrimonas alba TaxID=3349636 RepID=UPI0035F27E03
MRVKVASKNKGKSSGARIITCVKLVKDTIFLISIYDKSERQNITRNELAIILKQAGL